MVLENFEIVFWIRIPNFGGSVLQNIWFEASLYMFLIFGTLGGPFKVRFLVFENFKIIGWIRIPTFGGVCFMKLLDLRCPYICFWFFGTLGGLFWVWFLVLENFEIVFWIIIPTFRGVCFMKLFDLRLLCPLLMILLTVVE